MQQIKNMDGKSKNHWHPTDYGYSWTGHWLMAHLEGNGTVKYFAQEQMDQLKKELQFFRKVI
jgi:hypothetical protein